MKLRMIRSDADQKMNIPKFIYLVELVELFEFRGEMHLMIAFENKSVQIIELKRNQGTCCFELNFEQEVIS
jgi:hypothetical protein